MLRASRSVLTPSSTGARGRPHICSTALAVTTALLWGAWRIIPRETRLSRLPLGGRRGRFVSRTMRRGEPHRDGGHLRSGIHLTLGVLSRLHGPRAGGLHCCAASTIGSGWPLTMASAAPALPGSGWSERGGWCWILGFFPPLSPQLKCWSNHLEALQDMALAGCRRESWGIFGMCPFSSSIQCRTWRSRV